ncbi:hypothetical protein TRIUR3_02711 [Triticum urartu]|uniref:Uncharacterized protein n=1 Tax=Triticum urartu TaxID=4572 RepID=M7ZJ87_TRIUA|nr:hypothetical protein TRIUR3_02711 [Triticum urartu]
MEARWILARAGGRALFLVGFFFNLVRVCVLLRKARRRRLPEDGIKVSPPSPRFGGEKKAKEEQAKKLQAKKSKMKIDGSDKKKKGSSFKVGKKKVKTKLSALGKAKAAQAMELDN